MIKITQEMVMEFTEKNFEKEVINSELPVMVEFWGSWCPPCKMMDPVMAKLEEEYAGMVKIGKINADRNPRLRNRYNIRGVPTFIMFANGKEMERYVAAKSEDELRKILKRIYQINRQTEKD